MMLDLQNPRSKGNKQTTKTSNQAFRISLKVNGLVQDLYGGYIGLEEFRL